jgi:hypothetical protein
MPSRGRREDERRSAARRVDEHAVLRLVAGMELIAAD